MDVHCLLCSAATSEKGIAASRGPASTNLADAYRRLEAVVREHRRVLIWGIGGRSISLLSHMVWDSEVVAFNVDIDTKKQGMYVPITGERILSPAEAVAVEPDLIIHVPPVTAEPVHLGFHRLPKMSETGVQRVPV